MPLDILFGFKVILDVFTFLIRSDHHIYIIWHELGIQKLYAHTTVHSMLQFLLMLFSWFNISLSWFSMFQVRFFLCWASIQCWWYSAMRINRLYYVSVRLNLAFGDERLILLCFVLTWQKLLSVILIKAYIVAFTITLWRNM